ncbi:MAG: rhodanese-like domain-containing protein [Oligoflexia bacterium]|nr:rhodanese-like domain-containing protein [Oligoflexia bacterium]
MEMLSMRDLYQRLSSLKADELILDVRGPDEFAEGHVPGSRNIPHGEVSRFAAELQRFSRIYIHCHSGGRAMVAADLLRRQGLTNLVCVGRGGMGEWLMAGLPVER